MRMVRNDYPAPVNQLLTLGDPRQRRESQNWYDYASLGITAAHIPELIRIVLDDDLNSADSESAEVWAPVHAWRALGQLRAEAAIEPLVSLLSELIDSEDSDDWAHQDFPVVFGLIGPAAIAALSLYLADDSRGKYSRAVASHSLRTIAEQHPTSRPDCVTAIVHTLENFEQNDKSFNAFLISDLLELKAIECVSLIERAFDAKRVDELVNGDWEDSQIELGLKTEREHPPQYNVIRELFPSLSDSLAPVGELPGDDIVAFHPKQTASRATMRLKEKKEKAKRKAAEKVKKKRRKKKR